MHRILQHVGVAVAEAAALVLPVDCAGCGCPDTALCAACRARLSRPEILRRELASGLVVHAAFGFAGAPARVVRTLKEAGRTGLARPMGRALALTAAAAAWPDDAVFIAVPTSRAAYRRRGYRVVDTLLARSGLPSVRGLTIARTTADQRALGREERASNVADSMRAARSLRGRRLVVVDDVVTTGATLAEAARALTDIGARVQGALCFAHTERIVIAS